MLFDSVTGIYRGEFTGLNERIEFYATDDEQMIVEGRRSLAIFLVRCESLSGAAKGDALPAVNQGSISFATAYAHTCAVTAERTDQVRVCLCSTIHAGRIIEGISP